MKTSIKTLLIIGSFALATSCAKAADAAENWEKSCTTCHAKDGSGETTMGKKYGVKDYRDAKVQEAFSDEQAIKAITEGVTEDGKAKMKSFKEKFTEAEIKDLVAFVRSLKK